MEKIDIRGIGPLRNLFLVTGAAVISVLFLAIAPLLFHRTRPSETMMAVTDRIRLVPVSPPAVHLTERHMKTTPQPPPEPASREQHFRQSQPTPPRLETSGMELPEPAPSVPSPPDVDWNLSLPILPVPSARTDAIKNPSVSRSSGPMAPAPVQPVFSEGRFHFDEVDKKPQGLSTMPPVYPYKARRLALKGYVKVMFLVDRNGAVTELTILEAAPKGFFEETVEKTLPKWRFAPGRIDDRPVNTWMKKTIEFKLEAES